MRLQQIQKPYLYEGLDRSTSSSMLLWESAGFKLREAALTADQIQQLFAAVEKSATAQGDNRTMIGKGKDAVSAVNKAWEDLKTKIQDSGPVKGFDQKVSDVLSKIGMGAADPQFNGEVNKWVQKYRDFAKKHPIAQGAIYATLIGLAGITGAGVGGAAALGLLKMADKLLQGERFTSAAYSGVKAGAMAFAASKLGDYIKGLKQGDQVPPAGSGELPPGAPKMDFDKYDYYVGDSNNVVAVPKGAPNPFTGDLGAAASDTSVAAAREQARAIADRAVQDAVKSGVTRPNELADAAAVAMEKAGVGTNVGGKLAVQTAERIAQQAADAAGSVPSGAAMNPDYLQQVIDGSISRPKISADAAQAALDWQAQNGGQAVDAAANAASSAGKGFSKDYLEKVINGELPRPMISKEKAQELLQQIGNDAVAPADAAERTLKLRPRFKRPAESYHRSGRRLSEGQVYLVFNRVCARNEQLLAESVLMEGPLDAIKGAAGKGMDWLRTKGKNLTTKVTADKLNSAWQKAGSPTDSGELAKFLQSQGVNNIVVDQVFKDLKIPTAAASAGTTLDPEQIKAMIAKLPTDRKIRLINYMTKQLKVA